MAGTGNRFTIFSGRFKLFDKAFVRNLSDTGNQTGPGPHLNTRTVDLNKKPTSNKTTFCQEDRPLGKANQKIDHPGPQDYRVRQAASLQFR
jgi:hypothetical protein